MNEIKTVSIVGTGLIGASWAAFYASKGFRVKLYDTDKSQCELGLNKAVEYLNFLSEHDTISADTCKNAIG